MQLSVVSLADRPELADDLAAALQGGWPEFIFHDPVPSTTSRGSRSCLPIWTWSCWMRTVRSWPAAGASRSPGMGASTRCRRAGMRPCSGVSSSTTRAAHQMRCARWPRRSATTTRAGGSAVRCCALGERAGQRGLRRMIAPVRPTLKSRYPLMPIERFITWTRDDGVPLDPWLRTHWRLGARILKPAPRSMVMVGTVAEWEHWTGMRFPESGRYVVPDALDLVVIDREHDRGEYVEPNVWMRHP
jgi:hypothetical protein